MTRPTRPNHGSFPPIMKRKQDLYEKNLTESERLLLEAKRTDAYKLKHGWKFVITSVRPFTQTLMPKEKAKDYPKVIHA